MPTLTQGTNASVAVTSGQYVSLKNGPTDSARIDFASHLPHKIHHNGAAVYGPFDVAQSLKVSAVRGSVVYVAGSLATVAPMGRL
jgi:hypothetical protein